jgi:methionine-rich copper-binding protein CopC
MYGRLQRNQRNETRVLRSRWTALSFFAALACLTIQLPNHAVAQHSHGVLTPGVTFPTDDSVLDESPQMIMMSFRVDVTLLKLALYTAEGQWINIGFSYDPNRMADSFAYPLGFELPDSEYYIARWSVTDGKRGLLNGEFKFSIGDEAIPPSEIIASKVSDAVESLPSTGSYRVVPKE